MISLEELNSLKQKIKDLEKELEIKNNENNFLIKKINKLESFIFLLGKDLEKDTVKY